MASYFLISQSTPRATAPSRAAPHLENVNGLTFESRGAFLFAMPAFFRDELQRARRTVAPFELIVSNSPLSSPVDADLAGESLYSSSRSVIVLVALGMDVFFTAAGLKQFVAL